MYGHTGKILWVNLTTGEIDVRPLDEELARKWVGGAGLAMKLIWDTTTGTTEPFSGENPLVFMTGPVTGTRVPTSGRWTVAALSPLTNIVGEAHSGGSWGYALKLTGMDGIVVTGVAEKPMYLWIDGDKYELRDASSLWGMDTWETDEHLKRELRERVAVAAIGRAGERLVRFASIINDGRLGRAAARCGLGAVMGSKKLKAIAVRGVGRPQVWDGEGLKESLARTFIRKHVAGDVLR